MIDVDVKKLATQLDAAQSILDDIRLTCGCDAFGPARQPVRRRIETALEIAERALRNRQSRAEFIGTREIFGEPAWDMLLDLFIRQTKEEQVSMKTACLQAEAPATTVLRWLKVLEHNGLVGTGQDQADPSRHLIHLTPTGYEGMLRYLESIAP